jgi:CopG family transcriptional regulator, nickel-responsive regulator
MQRVTITLDDDLMADIDRLIAARGYQNRSEAIRDLARSGLVAAGAATAGESPCTAALVYVYDHEARELPKRLTRDFHAHHDLTRATMHVHLDAHNCMEVAVLAGAGADVQAFADHVIAERGVRHGQLVVVPREHGGHEHIGHEHAHGHAHTHPRERRRKA